MEFVRQTGLIDMKALKDLKITLVGAGGIGSFTGLYLCKMGIENIVIVDDDMVEEHNLPNQMYAIEDIGSPKVEALQKYIKMFSGVDAEVYQERFSEKHLDGGIVISAVDSMASREEIWEVAILDSGVTHLIDGRMAKTEVYVYAVDLLNTRMIERYEQSLYSDEEAMDVPCTERQTIYTGGGIAAQICNHVSHIANGKQLPSMLGYVYDTHQQFMASKVPDD